jgi:hypothetical protein
MFNFGNPHAAHVARQQIDALVDMAEQVGIENDRLQQLLRLFQEDAPIPARPDLPLLLRHMGWLTSRLDRVARSAYA